MKSLMAPLVFLAFTTATNADPLARQFAAEIVRQSVKLPEAELEFSEWQQSVSGGYILRFEFDVDGDGAKEQFMASSFNAHKLVCEWTIHAGASGERLAKSVLLRPSGFWWNPASRETLSYFRFGAEGGKAILSQFSKIGLTTREVPAALDEVKTGLGREDSPRQDFQRIKPDVMVSLLADVIANPESGWRPLILDDAGHNYGLPNDRLLLTEDAPRVEALRNFTPSAALETLQKSDSESAQLPNKLPATNSLQIVLPPTSKASEAKFAPIPIEKPDSSTPWIIIVVLIVAAIGLLWLLSKNRKS
jgi:hypothetical protein